MPCYWKSHSSRLSVRAIYSDGHPVECVVKGEVYFAFDRLILMCGARKVRVRIPRGLMIITHPA